MAFDVFLQPFANGEPSRADAGSISALLDSYVVAADRGWARLETTDGDADMYGYDDRESGLMINHAAGDAIWDLLVTLASAGPFAIMPVGCPTCVTDSSMLADLPPELVPEAVVVSSGRDLLQVIRGTAPEP